MTWSSPRTWTTAEFITRAIFQSAVRDEFLATATALAAAKGDTFWATAANTVAKLGVGANNTQIIADSTDPTIGVKWGYEDMTPRLLTLPDIASCFGAASQIPTSAAWPTANLAILQPFYLGEAKTLDKIHVPNGGTVSGNLDVGIYDASGTKIVTKGSTAQSGTNTGQVIDVANTALSAKTLYYAALVLDNTTGTIFRISQAAALLAAMGAKQVASSFALPASLTYAALASAYLPMLTLEFTA